MKRPLQIIGCVVLLTALGPLALPEERAGRVDALFAQYGKYGSPGCAIAITQNGETLYQQCFGLANLEHDIPITPETIFNIASISKPFTGLAVFLLEEEGKLSLDDQVRVYLPDFPDFGETVTIRHLLHHTSGLRDFLNLSSISGRNLAILSHQEMLAVIYRQRDLNFKPGDRYLYSNSNYVLLAEIVAQVSGMPFQEFTQKRIFDPLEMSDTFWQDDYRKVVPRRAASYQASGDGSYQASILHTSFIGSSNLHTTLDDLLKWDRNFDDPIAGNQDVFDKMLRQGVLNDGEEIAYAGGVTVGDYRGLRYFSHTGGHGGFRTIYVRFLEPRFSVILLANLANFDLGAFRSIADIYLFDSEDEEPVENGEPEEAEPSMAKLAVTYTGAYYSEELGVLFHVVQKEDDLLMIRTNLPEAPLQPTDEEDHFRHRGDSIRFLRNDAGDVTGFLLSGGRVLGLRFDRVELKRID